MSTFRDDSRANVQYVYLAMRVVTFISSTHTAIEQVSPKNEAMGQPYLSEPIIVAKCTTVDLV